VSPKFMQDIRNQPIVLEEFDEKFWTAVVNRVTVFPDGRLKFCFKGGSEVETERFR